jgi:ribonuclease P protein component
MDSRAGSGSPWHQGLADGHAHDSRSHEIDEIKEYNHEQKNISAEQHQACPHPWISCPHADPSRSGGHQAEKGQGAQATGRLNRVSRHALTKKDLLRTTGEFQRVYRGGRRIWGNGFAMIILPTEGERSRLGISVQKKTGNSVRRNRVKRLFREVFRLNRHMFPFPCDIVFTVRPGFADNSMGTVQASVARMLDGGKPAGPYAA